MSTNVTVSNGEIYPSDSLGGTMIIDPAVGSGGHPVVAPPHA